jgi:hypothetical protein
VVLQDYLTETRFLLEEFPSPGVYWTDTNLTTEINKARDRISLDTMCCRSQAIQPAVQGQIPYQYSAILPNVLTLPTNPPARLLARILNINFQWSPSFAPVLRNYAWSVLNAYFLANPSIQSQVLAWGQYDLQSIYIWPPSPNSTYTFQVDVTWLPTKLVNSNDPDNAIPEMVAEILVPLMAARWALFYRRDYTNAQYFEQMYISERNGIMAALPPFSIESWYDEEY